MKVFFLLMALLAFAPLADAQCSMVVSVHRDAEPKTMKQGKLFASFSHVRAYSAHGDWSEPCPSTLWLDFGLGRFEANTCHGKSLFYFEPSQATEVLRADGERWLTIVGEYQTWAVRVLPDGSVAALEDHAPSNGFFSFENTSPPPPAMATER